MAMEQLMFQTVLFFFVGGVVVKTNELPKSLSAISGVASPAKGKSLLALLKASQSKSR